MTWEQTLEAIQEVDGTLASLAAGSLAAAHAAGIAGAHEVGRAALLALERIWAAHLMGRPSNASFSICGS